MMKQGDMFEGIEFPSQSGELVANVRMKDLWLEVLLEEQAKLQRHLRNEMTPYWNERDAGPATNYEEVISLNVLAMHAELTEVLGEINWKPWKKQRKDVDRKALLLELVDITQFWANAVIAAGFTAEDIKAAYREKILINYQRAQEQLTYLKGEPDGKDHASPG